MLKIKDNINYEELKKFGFIKKENIYYAPLHKYKEIGMIIDEDKLIKFTSPYEFFPLSKWSNKIFDLIQAGLVEKVEA